MNRRNFIICSASAAALMPGQHANARSQQPWSMAAPLPINTQELYPVVHQAKLYVAGGIASKQGEIYFTDRFFSYDPNANEWVDEAPLPESLHHAALVSTGDRLFLVGGFNGSFEHFWRMRENVYEYKAGEWLTVTALPKPQAEGVLSDHKNDIHLVSGQSPRSSANVNRSDHQEVTTHWVLLSGGSKWETAAPIPLARNSATGGWVGDQLIVTGGRNAHGNFDHTHIYDKKEDRWRDAKPLPLPQAGTASVTVDDGLIVFGGEIFVPKAGVFKETWRYSLVNDQWSAYPDMKTPRHGIGAGKIGNKVFVVGGATEPSGKGTSNLNEVLIVEN